MADTILDGRYGTDPGSTYGGLDVLSVYQDWSSGEMRPLFLFDLTGVPAGEVVEPLMTKGIWSVKRGSAAKTDVASSSTTTVILSRADGEGSARRRSFATLRMTGVTSTARPRTQSPLPAASGT